MKCNVSFEIQEKSGCYIKHIFASALLLMELSIDGIALLSEKGNWILDRMRPILFVFLFFLVIISLPSGVYRAVTCHISRHCEVWLGRYLRRSNGRSLDVKVRTKIGIITHARHFIWCALYRVAPPPSHPLKRWLHPCIRLIFPGEELALRKGADDG